MQKYCFLFEVQSKNKPRMKIHRLQIDESYKKTITSSLIEYYTNEAKMLKLIV